MKTLFVPIVLLAMIALPAAAELIEFPMSTLPGDYPDGQAERTESFVFNMDPAAVQAAFLRVRGTTILGSVVCGDPSNPGPYPMNISASFIDETTGGWWWTFRPDDPGGEFEITLEFQGSMSTRPTWNFLGLADPTLNFFCIPMPLVGTCGPILSAPSAEITEVTLIFDMASTVPVEVTTWSTLKAVYR